ncbi:MAG: hypothetical protein FWF15_00275 [Oscillospiraceae bacterium]|nr:hypothetical protein [Oscillospiraceae bacterium]
MRKFIMIILLLVLVSCAKVDATLAGMKLISNNFVTYNLYVPDDWIVTSDDSTGYMGAYVSESDRSSINVIAFETKEQMTPDEFWEGYKKDLETIFLDIEYETVNKILLNGYEANCYEYSATLTGTAYKFMQVVRLHGGTVYIMTYTAVPENYEKNLEDVAKIINRFTFK